MEVSAGYSKECSVLAGNRLAIPGTHTLPCPCHRSLTVSTMIQACGTAGVTPGVAQPLSHPACTFACLTRALAVALEHPLPTDSRVTYHSLPLSNHGHGTPVLQGQG